MCQLAKVCLQHQTKVVGVLEHSRGHIARHHRRTLIFLGLLITALLVFTGVMSWLDKGALVTTMLQVTPAFVGLATVAHMT